MRVRLTPRAVEIAMSPSVQVFGRRNDGFSTHSDGRRPKSAKARNRGLGNGGGAATMGISPPAQALMWSKVAATCTILPRGVCVN
jgi:hypothetical protein